MLYITIRGPWLVGYYCSDVHVPTENKNDDTKDTFTRNYNVYLIKS